MPMISSIDSETNRPEEEKSKTALQRFQKVLAEQKRKLKLYTTRSWSLVEEKVKNCSGTWLNLPMISYSL